MPELHWRYGYPAVAGVSLAIVLGLVWFFKRKKWLWACARGMIDFGWATITPTMRRDFVAIFFWAAGLPFLLRRCVSDKTQKKFPLQYKEKIVEIWIRLFELFLKSSRWLGRRKERYSLSAPQSRLGEGPWISLTQSRLCEKSDGCITVLSCLRRWRGTHSSCVYSVKICC